MKRRLSVGLTVALGAAVFLLSVALVKWAPVVLFHRLHVGVTAVGLLMTIVAVVFGVARARGHRAALLALLAVGVVMRLLFSGAVSGKEETNYATGAVWLVFEDEGVWPGPPDILVARPHPQATSSLFGLPLWVADGYLAYAIVLAALVSLVAVPLAYASTWLATRRRGPATVAGLLVGVHPACLHFAGQAQSEVLADLVVLATAVFVVRDLFLRDDSEHATPPLWERVVDSSLTRGLFCVAAAQVRGDFLPLPALFVLTRTISALLVRRGVSHVDRSPVVRPLKYAAQMSIVWLAFLPLSWPYIVDDASGFKPLGDMLSYLPRYLETFVAFATGGKALWFALLFGGALAALRLGGRVRKAFLVLAALSAGSFGVFLLLSMILDHSDFQIRHVYRGAVLLAPAAAIGVWAIGVGLVDAARAGVRRLPTAVSSALLAPLVRRRPRQSANGLGLPSSERHGGVAGVICGVAVAVALFVSVAPERLPAATVRAPLGLSGLPTFAESVPVWLQDARVLTTDSAPALAASLLKRGWRGEVCRWPDAPSCEEFEELLRPTSESPLLLFRSGPVEHGSPASVYVATPVAERLNYGGLGAYDSSFERRANACGLLEPEALSWGAHRFRRARRPQDDSEQAAPSR